jgi:hypothetical protein
MLHYEVQLYRRAIEITSGTTRSAITHLDQGEHP